MEKLSSFFANTLVISWIAPIITGVVVVILTTIVGKFITIWWKSREFIRKRDDANQKYINNIIPYMIQEMEINSRILSSIKSAIAAEYQIAEKYLYTNEEIRDNIVLSISNTRFVAETNKLSLINNVIQVFNKIGEEKIISEDNEYSKKKVIDKKYPFITLLCSLVFLLVVYGINPDKIDDPSSSVQILLFIGIIFLLTSGVMLWVSVLGRSSLDISLQILDFGLINLMTDFTGSLGKTMVNLLYGSKRKKLVKMIRIIQKIHRYQW